MSPDVHAILCALNNALATEATKRRAPSPPIPTNARTYSCRHGVCDRPASASGLCNAHYLRHRQGRDMDAPFKPTKTGQHHCRMCQAKIGGKGGWGLCARHYKAARSAAMKAALVAHKGGACAHCGGVFPAPAFDFHHTGAKDRAISEMFLNASAVALAREVAACVLLCANCHRIHHANDGTALSEVLGGNS